MNEQEKKPAFAIKDIAAGGVVEARLDCMKPIKSGSNDFGTWNLWIVDLKTPTKVSEGRKPNLVMKTGYTGLALFFAKDSINETLLGYTQGKNKDVVVKFSKVFKEGKDGKPYTEYIVEKVSGGTLGAKNSPSESVFLEDMKKLKAEGITILESDLESVLEDSKYDITLTKAKELFREIQ
jgi:hypothetical protein